LFRRFSALCAAVAVSTAGLLAVPAAPSAHAAASASSWSRYYFELSSGSAGSFFDDGAYAFGETNTTNWSLAGDVLSWTTVPYNWLGFHAVMSDEFVDFDVLATRHSDGFPCLGAGFVQDGRSTAAAARPARMTTIKVNTGGSWDSTDCPSGTAVDVDILDDDNVFMVINERPGADGVVQSGCSTGNVHDGGTDTTVGAAKFTGNTATDSTASNCVWAVPQRSSDFSQGTTLSARAADKLGMGVRTRWLGASNPTLTDSL
jgi:hypothetical protein